METFTFLFTDIEGSTSLLRRLGVASYADVLAGHHLLIRAALGARGGEEVDTQGDAFFAVFSSPTACVAAAMEMQQAIRARTWPGGEQVRVRMGVHTGQASRAATGLVGLDVHRAARVAAVAYGGQILLSETAAAAMKTAAAAAHPLETGGILIGVNADGVPWVTHVIEIVSRDRSRNRCHPLRLESISCAGGVAAFGSLADVSRLGCHSPWLARRERHARCAWRL